MSLSKIALKAPRRLQLPFRYALSLIPASIRLGRTFRETTRLLDATEFLDRGRILEYQSDRLRELISHAYENVPYYRETFDRLGLLPSDIRTVYDLPKLPFLTKDILQSRTRDLMARNYQPSQVSYVTTGGSTGVPLGLYEETGVTGGLERAFIAKQWSRVGYRTGDRTAVFRGSVIPGKAGERLWEYNPLERAMVFSSYHLTEDRMPRMLGQLRRFRPLFIQAYPSSIYVLSEYMRKTGAGPIPSVRAILCGSENLYEFQRESITRAFQCRVFSWYGHSEKAVLAGECEHSSQYHVFPEYGISELIGDGDQPIRKEGESGEIVGTSLHNFVFPLIRYRTMDMATLGTRSCECGRNHMLLRSVEGRLQELIVSRTGRHICMAAMNMHSSVFEHVRQFQFYQYEPGRVSLKIVRREAYSDEDSVRIRRELGIKLGDDFGLELDFVDEIPRTTAGKYRFAIQRIPLTYGDR